MKDFNLKKVFIGLATILIMSAISTIAAYGQEKGESKIFPVRVKYVDGGKIVPNTVIYFTYWDEENSKLIEASANTSDGKTVTFNVPFSKKGNTYPFIVLLSKDDLETVKKSAGSGKIRAYRIPADAGCEYLELEIKKGGGGTNQGCSIQMWSI